jgi:hypothetical protein
VANGGNTISGSINSPHPHPRGSHVQTLPSSSFANGYEAELDAYDLYLTNMSLTMTPYDGTLHIDFTVRDTQQVEKFFKDLNTMNKIKGSQSEAVINHYEELMTLLALTKEEKDK